MDEQNGLNVVFHPNFCTLITVTYQFISLRDPIWIAAASEHEAKIKAETLTGKTGKDLTVVQDEDVLDTWFSSSLFPFACFGWPNDSEDLKRFVL